nr:hypothetical protein [uncultured Dethiosulfovibrio sp.]
MRKFRLALVIFIPVCVATFFYANIVSGGKIGALLTDYIVSQGDFLVDISVTNNSEKTIVTGISNVNLVKRDKWPYQWKVVISQDFDGSKYPDSSYRVLYEVLPGKTITFPSAMYGNWNDVIGLRPLSYAEIPDNSGYFGLTEEFVSEGEGISFDVVKPTDLSSSGIAKIIFSLDYDGYGLKSSVNRAKKAEIKEGFSPTGGIAVDSNGNIYTVSVLGGFVSSVSIKEGSTPSLQPSAVKNASATLDTPIGVAVGPDTGNIYVTDFGTSKLVRYDKDLNKLGEWTVSGTMPSAVALDHNPTNPEGRREHPYVVTAPKSLKAALDGKFGQNIEKIQWDVAEGGGFVNYFNVENLKTALGGAAGNIFSIYDIAFDSSNKLHALIGGSRNFIVRIGSGGVESGIYSSWNASPMSLAFNASDDIVLSDLVKNRVLRYPSDKIVWGAPTNSGDFGDTASTLIVPESNISGSRFVSPDVVAKDISLPIAVSMPNGNIAISEAGSGKVVVVNPVSPDVRLLDQVIDGANPTPTPTPSSSGGGCILGNSPAMSLLMIIPLLLLKR